MVTPSSARAKTRHRIVLSFADVDPFVA